MKSITKATLGRLPIYLQYLKTIKSTSQNISATQIAKDLDLGEVQVRKDLASVSGKGRPKTGYKTEELICQLENCLGQKDTCQVILVGAGKLGRALLDCEGFKDYGIEIIAAFDIYESVHYSESGKPIYPLSEMQGFCFMNGIKIGIITVSENAAQEICDLMIKCNISAIWSFARCELIVPENVVLLQEKLELSLAHLHNKILRRD